MKRKQFLCVLLALSMVIPLASCGSPQQNDESSETSVTQPVKPVINTEIPDTQPKIVFEKGGKTFYAGKMFYYLTNDTGDAAVTVQTSQSSSPHFKICSKTLAFCGSEFYGIRNGSFDSIIWHVNADDTGTMHMEKLYTPDQVQSAAEQYCDKDIVNEEITQAAEDKFINEVRGIMMDDYNQQYEKPYEQTGNRPENLPTYGEFEVGHLQEYLDQYRDKLYQKHYDEAEQNFWSYTINSLCNSFCYPTDGGDGYIYAALYLNKKRCLGRFAKDGSSYEVFNDILLSSFTISEGWLYYYDSGAEKINIEGNTLYDAKRRGLYKMRLDGSEKSQLLSNITLKIDETSWYDDSAYGEAVLKPRVVGDYLYYLLANEEGCNYHLYRIPTAGGTPELCAPINCYNYTVDASGNTLCYYGCEDNLTLGETDFQQNDKLRLVLKNLSDGTEQTIPTSQVVSYSYNDEMQIVDGTLYVSSDQFSEGTDIDTSEQGYENAFTSEGILVRITEPEYQMYKYSRAGLRIDLTTGKAEWMLRYHFFDRDIGSAESEENLKNPWQTVWKDADQMDEELNSLIRKYNIDENYLEPPVYEQPE